MNFKILNKNTLKNEISYCYISPSVLYKILIKASDSELLDVLSVPHHLFPSVADGLIKELRKRNLIS